MEELVGCLMLPYMQDVFSKVRDIGGKVGKGALHAQQLQFGRAEEPGRQNVLRVRRELCPEVKHKNKSSLKYRLPELLQKLSKVCWSLHLFHSSVWNAFVKSLNTSAFETDIVECRIEESSRGCGAVNHVQRQLASGTGIVVLVAFTLTPKTR